MTADGRPKLWSLTALFLRVGNITFGGGDVITATLMRELVHRRRWLTFDEYGLAQSLAKITPGTGILAFSAAAGWLLRRWSGTLAAVLTVSVPSGVVVVLITWGVTSLGPGALGALAVVLASAVGMMWAAAWLLVRPQFRRHTWTRTAVMVATAYAALAHWSVSPLPILIASALVGLFWIDATPHGRDADGADD